MGVPADVPVPPLGFAILVQEVDGLLILVHVVISNSSQSYVIFLGLWAVLTVDRVCL